MATQSLLTVTVLLVSVTSLVAVLPNGWKACRRSASDYDECLRQEVQHAIHSLNNGDKKLGVHPLDPLRISLMEIPKSPGPVSLELKFKDLDIIGIKDVEILSIKNDWKNLNSKIRIPHLIVTGEYQSDGKVLVLPIKAKGTCKLTFDDMRQEINSSFSTIQKNGKSYFHLDDINLATSAKAFNINLTNLFNGTKEFGDNMNKFLNDNSMEILTEMNPTISSALAKVFKQIANTVLAKIPVNEIDKE